MKILYPIRVDACSGVSNVFREVGRRSKHEIHGFVGDSFEGKIDGIFTHKLPSATTIKALSYSIEQLGDYEIIQTSGYPQTTASALSQILSSTSIIHTVHSPIELWRGGWNNARLRLHRRVMLSIADSVITVSPYLKSHLSKYYGIEATSIPNGVSMDDFSPDVAETVDETLLYVGRPQEIKHTDFVLDLAERMPEYSFRLRVDANRRLEKRSRQIDNVTILGRLPKKKLAREFARANALVCPFEYEGFGLVVVEAFASGTPVVGLDSGNLPNLISDNDTGFLVEELDIVRWTDAISKCNRGMEEGCLKVAESYSWDTVVELYDSVYNKFQ